MKIIAISNNHLHKAAAEDIFHTNVNVSFWVNRTETEAKEFDYNLEDRQVMVSFRIDADWRSWGLKSALISIVKIQPIEVSITRYDPVTGDDKEVRRIQVMIDPTKLKTEKFHSQISSVTVGELELTIDLNGAVNYDESSITVYEV